MTGRGGLALRGLIAVATALAVSATLVARAAGHLDNTTNVYVGVPVSAGLISTAAPVRYHGVNVGRIAEIESGSQTSRVRLAVDDDALDLIPATVRARVVPRTFFGDVYLQLVDDGAGGGSSTALAKGDTIAIDDSPDAMALYDVFTRIVEVFNRIQPEKMQTALTALSQGLRNRGGEIGSTIDDLSAATQTLTPSLNRFLDSTPQFRTVLDALHAATPDIVTTLAAATSVSNRMVADGTAFGELLGGVAGLGGVLTSFLSDHREQLITVVDSAGKILATTAATPRGLVGTLAGAQAFGDAGGRVFSTGKFNITAVATFAGPMPYSAADCPFYGHTYGAHCADSDPANPVPTEPLGLPLAPPARVLPDVPVAPALPGESFTPAYPAEVAPAAAVVDAPGQAHALSVLEEQVLGHPAGPSPNIATVLMLGPLVRGTEVRVS